MYKNVLLIDDNYIDNFINSTFVKNSGLGATIYTFLSVKPALEFLKDIENNVEENPTIIFLDLDMPEMNGFNFLDEFVTFPSSITQSVNIIILSSSVNPNDLQKGIENPYVSKIIPKPLTSNFLLSYMTNR